MRKLKYALGGIIALFAFLACDDNTGRLGMDMLPPTDSITASKATYNVTTKSVLAGRVYAKSSIGYVGRFTDPDFGYYESSFLSELYCVENYQFPEEYRVTSYDENGNPKTATGTMVEDDPLVSSDLILYYYNWFGDSLNACRMSVYELNDKWKVDRNDPEREYRYTDIDTESYKGNYLGSITYSAYDTTVPDSVRNATDSDGYSTYVPNLTLQLPKERGEEIFRLNREHPEYFADAESFIENVFPGVYIQSDYGDGTILYVEYIYLTMRFKFYATDLGVRNIVSPMRDGDVSAMIENIVFNELRFRYGKVVTFDVDGKEIDFVADSMGSRRYYQVCMSIADDATRERELRPLRDVRDNYPKTVITLDRYPVDDIEGIRVVRLVDWLQGK